MSDPNDPLFGVSLPTPTEPPPDDTLFIPFPASAAAAAVGDALSFSLSSPPPPDFATSDDFPRALALHDAPPAPPPATAFNAYAPAARTVTPATPYAFGFSPSVQYDVNSSSAGVNARYGTERDTGDSVNAR